MSKHTQESSTKTPKSVPKSVIEQVKKDSEKARTRFNVPFELILLEYISVSECGKKKILHNNPLGLIAEGSESKIDGLASYRSVEECYERYCLRYYNRGNTFPELLKSRRDLIETQKKYNTTED